MTALRAAAPGLELPRHLRAAGSAVLYLLLGLTWGLLYLLLGVVLAVAWVVRPLLPGALGTARVRGLVVAEDASFQIQAISGGDDVLVEGGR